MSRSAHENLARDVTDAVDELIQMIDDLTIERDAALEMIEQKDKEIEELSARIAELEAEAAETITATITHEQ